MLIKRIVHAITFRSQVYRDVKQDVSFTPTAWAIVVSITLVLDLVAAAFLLPAGGLIKWLLTPAIETTIGVATFGVASFVTAWLGRALFKAETTFDEMVRTLGLAEVWGVIAIVLPIANSRLLGPTESLSPERALSILPLLLLLALVVSVPSLVSGLIASHEAMSLNWWKTVVAFALGRFAGSFFATIASSVVFGILGIQPAAYS